MMKTQTCAGNQSLKPRLTAESYKKNYLPEGITEEERYKKIEDRDMILTEQELLLMLQKYCVWKRFILSQQFL